MSESNKRTVYLVGFASGNDWLVSARSTISLNNARDFLNTKMLQIAQAYAVKFYLDQYAKGNQSRGDGSPMYPSIDEVNNLIDMHMHYLMSGTYKSSVYTEVYSDERQEWVVSA